MHRNSQKRIYGDYVYFITCNVQDKIEFFKEEIFCEFWIEELKLAKEMKKFELYAICLNYDHFHILIKPDNEIADYSKIMQFIKRNFSQNVNKILGYTKFIDGDIVLTESDDAHRRFQQQFDKTTYQYRQKYIAKFGKYLHHPKFKWQKSFFDHIIRNEKDYEYHWNYTMNNFAKHHLPENWKYTGLNYQDLIDDSNDDKIWNYI